MIWPFKRPAPEFTSTRPALGEALRNAKRERENAMLNAKVDRTIAQSDYDSAVDDRDTRRQHHAAKRLRTATHRCLELGV